MKCLHPITIRVLQASGKFAIYQSSVPGEVHYREVPCGRCYACRRRYQNSWAFRIQKEAENSACAYFITLTYSDENLVYGGDGNATLVKSHLSSFMKRFRQSLCRWRGSSESGCRFFACGEYGDTFGRPHNHAILFFDQLLDSLVVESFVSKCWKMGFVKVSPFSLARSRYVAKYCTKQNGVDYDKEMVQPPFALMSRRPGIGSCFRNSANLFRFQRSLSHFVADAKGVVQSLPRYYSEYFFSSDQRAAWAESISLEQHAKDLLLDNYSSDTLIEDVNRLTFQSKFYDSIQPRKQVNLARFKRCLQEACTV